MKLIVNWVDNKADAFRNPKNYEVNDNILWIRGADDKPDNIGIPIYNIRRIEISDEEKTM